MGTVIHIQYASGGNPQAVMVVTPDSVTSEFSIGMLVSVPGRTDLCVLDHSPPFCTDRTMGKHGGQSMHGNEKVIEQLNSALSSELTAIVQYMTQSEMCQNWGYKRLGESTKVRAIEEMRHAEGLIERIIFLDSIPTVEVGLKPQLGSKVQQQIEINLKDEQDAMRQYNEAVKICVQARDEGSKALFDRMIQDEERHADFLEAQLHAIQELGIANYLSQQLYGEK
jgi:bacterioferritin